MNDSELQARAIVAAALIQSKIVDIHGVNLTDPHVATSHMFQRLHAAVNAVMIAIGTDQKHGDAESAAATPHAG